MWTQTGKKRSTAWSLFGLKRKEERFRDTEIKVPTFLTYLFELCLDTNKYEFWEYCIVLHCFAVLIWKIPHYGRKQIHHLLNSEPCRTNRLGLIHLPVFHPSHPPHTIIAAKSTRTGRTPSWLTSSISSHIWHLATTSTYTSIHTSNRRCHREN